VQFENRVTSRRRRQLIERPQASHTGVIGSHGRAVDSIGKRQQAITARSLDNTTRHQDGVRSYWRERSMAK
jgi:hypothetical protein